MNDPLADFHSRLFNIRPFAETLSPPSSPKKELSCIETSLLLPPTLVNGSLPNLAPLKRTVSDGRQLLGESNYKTISSISSTIDMLFSKIEKIKEEFSYALDKTHSESELQHQFHHTSQHQFHSQRIIGIEHSDKENIPSSLQGKQNKEKVEKVEQDLTAGRFIMHSLPLPLQEHNQNLAYRDYHSHQAIPPQTASANLFQNFATVQQTPVSPTNSLKISDFHLGKCIGSGKFGDVYLSMHRTTGFLCAIKKIFKSTIREYGMESQLATELRIHYSLSHPNVVQLYGHFDDEYHIFLMMEYACDGSLIDRLKCQQPEAATAVGQLLQAVSYLHRKRVVHRDIKPQNIVCAMGVAKLCDFGWAAVLQNLMKRTFCGTLDYVSPQMKDVGEYNESVDLWSIGVLAFELLAGFPPYKHQISNWKLCGSQRKVRWNWEVIYPPEMSSSAQKFIQGLLKENPIQRATIQECLCSAFIGKQGEEWDVALEREFQFDC